MDRQERVELARQAVEGHAYNEPLAHDVLRRVASHAEVLGAWVEAMSAD